MIERIATVTVYVDDQGKALDFWTKRMGFEVRAKNPMAPGAGWIELAPSGAQTCLVIYPKSMMPNWAEMKPSIIFQCADAEATYRALKEKGVEFTDTPKKMAWGTYAKFTDGQGNEFLIRS